MNNEKEIIGKISIFLNTKTMKYKVSNCVLGLPPVYLGFITKHKREEGYYTYYVPKRLKLVPTLDMAIDQINRHILNTLGTKVISVETDDETYWRFFYG